VGKEALLMAEKKVEGREGQERSRCQIGYVPGKIPSSCAEAAKEMVDGLALCERHALEAKLEGQIECWEEMLFHIELWSKEASRRQRPDVVGALQDQRAGTVRQAQSLRGLGCAKEERDDLGESALWDRGVIQEI
jgi:hypothetical protein